MKTQFLNKNLSQSEMQMIAMAINEGIDFFEYDDVLYTGMSQDKFDAKEEALLADPDYENREEVDARLAAWIDENLCGQLDDEFTVSSYDENIIEYAGGEYLVVDESTANDLWEAELDNYLEECVYPELSGNLAQYFDDEKWKRDARIDGRGHSLAGYDGNESNVKVDGTEFCIFRIN